MATTSSFTISHSDKKPALQGSGYDWAQVLLQTLFLGGLFVDGWAHFHGKVDDSFFTPWHAVFYGGFALCAGFLILTLVVNRARGYLGRAMLPVGYDLSLLGTVIFAGGGVADMFWHIAFGIEQNTEALLSPSHLLLAAGMFLTLGGPFRAAWHRRGMDAPFSAILSMALMLTVATFITSYANPIVEEYYGGTEMVMAVMLTTGLTMGLVLLALRRWTLKPGSLMLVFTVNAAFMSVLQDQQNLILPWFVAGLLADGLYFFLRPRAQGGKLRWFAFGVPALWYGLYFLNLFLREGLRWRIHTWGGGIVLAGVTGLFLSYLMIPPALPGEEK